MPTCEFSGSLLETPQGCGDPGQVSSATTAIPFVSNPPRKSVGASTGRKFLNVQSPGEYVTLFGDGTEADPQQAATVYCRVRSGGFSVRVTFNNPADPDEPIVAVLPLMGTFLHEPDVSGSFYATKFEIQGQGAVEFYASGAQ